MLSVVTDTNIDVVRSAMKVFQELNMIEFLEDKTIYMLEVEKMIGSASQDEHARESTRERVRRFRDRQKQECIEEEKRYSNVTCNGELKLNKELNINNSIGDFWEDIWGHYPIKKGKGKVSDTQKKKLFKYGIDQMRRCVDRYVDGFGNNDRKYMMHGSTFFNSGYVDYLDENFEGSEPPKKEAIPESKPIEESAIDLWSEE